MVQSTARSAAVDPLHRLARNPFCDAPDVDNLTVEQQYALHEFFHQVLVAGYKLYQVVPASLAGQVLRKKFHLMAGVPIPTPEAD